MRPGGLFLKYAIPLVFLVSGALVVSALVEIYFGYQENKAALSRLQHEKALAAAQRIEQFVHELERQLAWIAQTPWGPRGVSLDQRRLDSLRLLRHAPAVTEVSHYDPSGHEQLRVSRLEMDVVGSNIDFSDDPKFKEAIAHKVYYGPVYFRKESEPYMTIAIAGIGEYAGVVAAEANLKFILDVVSEIEVGESGRAYVVDKRGRLIAHPDISMVLQKTDVSDLPQVVAAFTATDKTINTPTEPIMGRGLRGERVISANAPMETLDWHVFVDLPMAEAFAPIYASMQRTLILLLIGLVISGVASLILVRRMVRPIQSLQAGAARIGSGALDHRIVVKGHDELGALADEFNNMAGQLKEYYAGLEQKVEERTRELTEALERQTATSDILRVISESQTDVQPVFDKITESCKHLFNCSLVGINVVRPDELIDLAAYVGPKEPELRKMYPVHLDHETGTGMVIRERRAVHFPDALAEGYVPPTVKRGGELAGVRSIVFAPLVLEDRALGAIFVARDTVSPFSEQEIALLRTFADQAVIAIENTRLFNELESRNSELTEALERQTATSDILRVISSSPTDLQPVLDAVVESAARLCGSQNALLFRLKDGKLYPVANYGDIPVVPGVPLELDTTTVGGASVVNRTTVQVPDLFEVGEEFKGSKQWGLQHGNRAIVATPMLRQGVPVGALMLRRVEPGPFDDRQIELLKTFADQAVIAIENTRLFTELEARNNELSKALDRMTATSEILRVTSESQTDVQPVFDTIVDRAATLVPESVVALSVLENGTIEFKAFSGDQREGADGLLSAFPKAPDGSTATSRAILERKVISIEDIASAKNYALGAAATAINFRSAVAVPILREGRALGAISLVRKREGGLDAHQVELIRTFADQAAIAIENTRLFRELEARNRDLTEALERQTATNEILRVTTKSQRDVQPVFEAIARNARHLCRGHHAGLFIYDGKLIHCSAMDGVDQKGMELMARTWPMSPGNASAGARSVATGKTVYIPDVTEDAQYELDEVATEFGYRSIIALPMLRGKHVIGTIIVTGPEPGMFNDRQLAALETFANQAVIAIENTRLFNELESRNRDLTESLEQQTATSEILRTISESQTDVRPVFDSIIENALRLCGATNGLLCTFDGTLVRVGARTGAGDNEQLTSLMEQVFPSTLDNLPNTTIAKAITTRSPVYEADVTQHPDYPEGKRLAQVVGYRSIASVPMLRDGNPIGTITIAGPEPDMFTDRHIALLQTFADQAVIATENVRLFHELEERLEQETGTSEILRVISQSQTDVLPVMKVIAKNARELTHGMSGGINMVRDGQLHFVTGDSLNPQLIEAFARVFPRPVGKDTAAGRAILSGKPAYVRDVTRDADYGIRDAAQSAQYRSLVSVPMLREGKAIGAVTVTAAEPDMFTDRQVAMLQTFGDQAVIAIENVRLFNELEERLEQQTATSDILRVISKSQTDVQPVFETICANARKLCDASWSVFYTYDGEMLHYAATNDMSHVAVEATRHAFPRKPDLGSALGRAILTGSVAYIKDVLEDKDYNLEELARVAMYRSTASVPVLRGDIVIGAISVSSTEPDRFSDRQLGMLQTFADQAVIAIQNTRLFNELQSRTQELARSVEQLRSLSEVGQAVNSTLDLQEVLSTIVKNAVELSGADSGVVFEADEEIDSFQLRATYRMPPQLVDIIRVRPLRGGEGATGRAAELRQPVQIPELKQAPDYYSGSLQRLSEVAGLRSLLAVPLVREGRVLGSLAVARKIPGEFAPEIVNLLQTFAAQSTLAIQNARLFREIAEKSRELEVASQHKSQFLANMSHELRTPLNAILGYTELISDGIYGEMPEKMGEIMERVQSSGRNLLGLINDVLDLSKIEAGQLELAINDYSFHDIVHSVVSSVESLAAEKQLKLSTNLPTDLPVGKGDERRIAQVLMNLVGNAIKFTDAGEVVIDVAEADQNFIVSVRDTGPGVPEEQKETIFEEFQQVDSSSTRKKGGTGLGLAISRRIVELHGGEIWLEATSGNGSTFTFSVPVNAMIREVAA